jgi:YVTN family beta-propeller protein
MYYSNLFFTKPGRAALWARVSLWLVLALLAISISALPAQAQPFACVSNYADNTVSVIDIASNAVTATVQVGQGPIGVAITPDGIRAYVTNSRDGTVSVIDLASNSVVATVPVGVAPDKVAITPDGAFAYVANISEYPSGTLSVINVASNMVVATVALGGAFPYGLAVSPDGAYVYVADMGPGEDGMVQEQVEVISTASNTVATVVPLALTYSTGLPTNVALTPDGAFAYAPNIYYDAAIEVNISQLSVISTADNTVSTNILLGPEAATGVPLGIAFTPNGAFAYVTNFFGSTTLVIDVANNTLYAAVEVGAMPFDVAVSPDGAFAYVTVTSENAVSVIDVATNTVVNTVTVGAIPYCIAIAPDGGGCVDSDPPEIATITVPVDPILVGTSIDASASFTDATDNNDHTAVWDWGDNSTSSGTVDQINNIVAGSHAYAAAGVYSVSLTVTDGSGNSDLGTAQGFVVIYDPTNGFVTGGGWINSPPGAYVADPVLSGKANFGFVSKYKKGQSVPDGNTTFHFNTANFKFGSTSYDWMVIAGPQAKYKGVGTVNNSGNYGFMLSAIDGQIIGGGGVDKFRIKIWDRDNGDVVVYDNQMGDPDDGDATDAIEGGSIQIQKSVNKEMAEESAGEQVTSVPTGYSLEQNYPNPFNPETEISFSLSEAGQVVVKIFSITGEAICMLANGKYQAGSHSLCWNGRNKAGNTVAAGIYLYQINAFGENGELKFTATRRMALVK